jgi:signal transduction histidine kinase
MIIDFHKHRIIIFLLVSMSFFKAHGDSDLDSYLLSLKNLDFPGAKNHLKKIGDVELKNECQLLIDILYFSGQQDIDFVDKSFKKNTEKDLIHRLSKGYHILFSDRYTSEPFKYFQEVYEASLHLKNDELIKFSLLSIIKIYNYEIFRSKKGAMKYLQDYKKISSDNADLYHYRINFLINALRNQKLTLEFSENDVNDLHDIMVNFERPHKFWPNYLSTIGVTHWAYYFTFNKSNENEKADFHLKKATEYYIMAIEAIKDEPYLKYLKFRTYIKLASIVREQKQFGLALSYMNESKKYIDLSDPLRSNYYVNKYSSFDFYGLKQYKRAFESIRFADSLIEKLAYNKNTSEINYLNTEFQTEKKEKEILGLNNKNLKSEAKRRKNQNIALGLGVSLVLGSIIAILIFINTKRKQKIAEQERTLESQKLATVLKEQELVSIDAMIEGQEKERQRIANDLHDDLGGLLATVKLHFNALNNIDSPELYNKTNDLIEEAYQKVRSVAHAKNSGVIAKQGLLTAVQNMADKISVSNDIQIEVVDYGLDNRLENSLELTLFRIIQELVTNIIKHADATEVTIHLTNHGDRINIMVEDNGKGFDTHQITKSNAGMGISSIDKRVEHLDGELTIESEQNKGTTIIIDIPL